MILKNCLVVVGFWTLLVAPFLCGIGVPVHSDTCEESSECRHELQCFTDPCRILALRSVHQNGRWEHSASPVAQLNPPALVDDFAAPGQTQTELIADPAGGLSKMVVFEWSVPLLC